MSSNNMLGKYIKLFCKKVIQVSPDRNYLVTVGGKYRDLLENEKTNKTLYWHILPKDIRDIIKSYLSDSEYVNDNIQIFYVDPPTLYRKRSRDSYVRRNPVKLKDSYKKRSRRDSYVKRNPVKLKDSYRKRSSRDSYRKRRSSRKRHSRRRR